MDNLLKRNIAEILPSLEDFAQRLKQVPVKIYLGIDPSAPEIHIGNAVALWKLREFQDIGHQVILLIGDFTGMIGDPTDKGATRKKLTKEEVLENAKTYQEQAGKILNFSGKNPAKIKFNSEWLAKLNFGEVIELAALITDQQMHERDFFRRRIEENKPIYLHEFLYPLMQGYDSVAMEVDAEIGGTDQTFNMLVGRTLMKTLKNKEKFVVSVPLLEGLDGRKMSKSFKNYIGIMDKPEDMFGKVMSLRDELIQKYFELATKLPKSEIQSIEKAIQSNEMSIMDAKKRLAWEIVKLYHGEKAAGDAQEEFKKVFQQKTDVPRTIAELLVKAGEIDIIHMMVDAKTATSNSEAKRLFNQGAVEINGQVLKDQLITLKSYEAVVVKVGKNRFFRIAAK